VVLAVILLGFGIYAFEIGDLANKYIVQVNNIILICYLLWRVETLSDLSISSQQREIVKETASSNGVDDNNELSLACHENIGPLLRRYCIDTQLYLQHDLSLLQLAKVIGTNRTYLSQYFSSQDMTYNAYINNLRVKHFVSLFRDAVVDKRSFSAQQLAQKSGFHSYRTFSDAFKRMTGQSVTAWMKAERERLRERLRVGAIAGMGASVGIQTPPKV